MLAPPSSRVGAFLARDTDRVSGCSRRAGPGQGPSAGEREGAHLARKQQCEGVTPRTQEPKPKAPPVGHRYRHKNRRPSGRRVLPPPKPDCFVPPASRRSCRRRGKPDSLLDRQPFPAFRPASGQHLASATRRHAGAETVRTLALDYAWLKCPFHQALAASRRRPAIVGASRSGCQFSRVVFVPRSSAASATKSVALAGAPRFAPAQARLFRPARIPSILPPMRQDRLSASCRTGPAGPGRRIRGRSRYAPPGCAACSSPARRCTGPISPASRPHPIP